MAREKSEKTYSTFVVERKVDTVWQVFHHAAPVPPKCSNACAGANNLVMSHA